VSEHLKKLYNNIEKTALENIKNEVVKTVNFLYKEIFERDTQYSLAFEQAAKKFSLNLPDTINPSAKSLLIENITTLVKESLTRIRTWYTEK